jgi:N-acetylneuraminate synthase/sialic acid synthase
VVNRELTIDGVRIADDSDAFVIAEIGHNHQGNLTRAHDLFARAAECGVSAVKLQKRDNATLFTRALYDTPYEHENSFGPTYGRHREALELGRDEYIALQDHARRLRLCMFATAFDMRSADFLATLNVPAIKIASGDLKNVPLLRYVAQLDRPVVLSTGGGTMDDISRAVDAVIPHNPHLCLLQCTASYPAEPGVMNLRVIVTLRERFPELVVGLSDHQNGIALASVAYALGARVIEKHFTLNRTAKGTDHAFSLEPAGMRKLVRDLHRTREAMGDGIKRVYEVESRPLLRMSKKLTAATDLPAGHVLESADFRFQSPGDGLPPHYVDALVGNALVRPVRAEEAFTLDHVAPVVKAAPIARARQVGGDDTV